MVHQQINGQTKCSVSATMEYYLSTKRKGSTDTAFSVVMNLTMLYYMKSPTKEQHIVSNLLMQKVGRTVKFRDKA